MIKLAKMMGLQQSKIYKWQWDRKKKDRSGGLSQSVRSQLG